MSYHLRKGESVSLSAMLVGEWRETAQNATPGGLTAALRYNLARNDLRALHSAVRRSL